MKKIAIFLIIVGACYAQTKITLDDNRYAEKIDNNSIKVVTTYEQLYEKKQLLEEKQMLQNDIARTQERIDEIDNLLKVFD